MSFVAQYALSGAFSLYLGYKSYSTYYSNVEFEELIGKEDSQPKEEDSQPKEEDSQPKEEDSQPKEEEIIDNNCDKTKTNLIVKQMTNDFFKKNLEETRRIKKKKHKKGNKNGNKKGNKKRK